MEILNGIKKKLRSDKNLSELIKGSSTAFIIKIFGIITSYLFTFIVTRLFNAEILGTFTLFLVTLQIASTISRFGTDTALLKFTAEYIGKKDSQTLKTIYKKILKLSITTTLITSITLYLLSPIIAVKLFNKPFLTDLFKIASLALIPMTLLFIHTEGIRGLKKIKEYMLLQQAGVYGLATILLIILLGIYKSSKLPVVSYTISLSIISLISLLLWIKYIKLTSKKSNHSTTQPINYSSILTVSIPMLLSTSLGFIMGWTDTIMLGIFRTTEEVGIYNIVLKLSIVTGIPLIAINSVTAPKIAEFWGKKDIKSIKRTVKQSTKLLFLSSLPIITVYLIFPDKILSIFGNSFKTGTTALLILSIGQFINTICGSIVCTLMMTDRQKTFQIIMLISTMLNIILNFIFIPTLSISGAATASALSLFTINLLSLINIRKMLQ